MNVVADIQQALRDFQAAHRRSPVCIRLPLDRFQEFAQFDPVDLDAIFGDGAADLAHEQGIEMLCTAGLIGGVPLELDRKVREITVF